MEGIQWAHLGGRLVLKLAAACLDVERNWPNHNQVGAYLHVVQIKDMDRKHDTH